MPDDTTVHVPAERQNFKALLANPNHFGTLKNSKFPAAADIQGNTSFEAITCVGYNPELRRLEATVQLNVDSGRTSNHASASIGFCVRLPGPTH